MKMRSSKNGSHEEGGKHISGVERIIKEEELESEIIKAYRRARNHERGDSDFINIKIEKIDENDIIYKKKLNINQHHVSSKKEGLELAGEILKENSVSEMASQKAIELILGLENSMHGAILLDKDTGKRLDEKGNRGVRVTGISSANIDDYKEALKEKEDNGLHLEEALILASKVTSCRGITAELCWSDDPNYVIGYIGTKENYERIPIMKDRGNPIGGRVFFIDTKELDENYGLNEIIDYLENQIVLIE